MIYPADAPSPSSPEHDINESHSSLSALCRDSDSSLSTIILGSITSFNPSNGFPIADFSAAGCTRARHPRDPWAPGLAKCPELGDEVRRCQELGRKVVLRIGSGGGAGGGKHGEVEGPIDGTTTTSTITALPTEEEEQLASALWFRDAPDARRAAVNLWKLFGQGDTHGPTGADSMRPLGEGVVVDGFDLGELLSPFGGSGSVTWSSRGLPGVGGDWRTYLSVHLSQLFWLCHLPHSYPVLRLHLFFACKCLLLSADPF